MPLAACLTFLAVVLSPFTPLAHGCAKVAQVFDSVDGRLDGQAITKEQAVIIWDEERKVEHFIREAEIATTSPTLGFLVPTPNTPELAEADARIFALAEALTKPKEVPVVKEIDPAEIVGTILMGPMQSLGGKISQVFETVNSTLGVQVIASQRVGGYDAVVLAATDAGALSTWIKGNGFQWNENLTHWLRPYIAAGWKITAFKLANQGGPNQVSGVTTGAVRMSFAAAAPFFPYSEPKESPPPRAPRVLEVSILSDHRMSGGLADGAGWPGVLLAAGPTATPIDPAYTPAQWLQYARLDPAQTKLPTTLTGYRDLSIVRPGSTDLFFYPDADQSPWRREVTNWSLPPQHKLVWHGGTTLLACLAAVLVPVALIRMGLRVCRMPPAGQEAAPYGKVDRALVFVFFLYLPFALLHLVGWTLAAFFMPPFLMGALLSYSVLDCGLRLLKPARRGGSVLMGGGSMLTGVIFIATVIAQIYGAM